MLGRLRNLPVWSWIKRIEPLIWNLAAYGLVAAVPAAWAIMKPFVPPGWSWLTAVGVFLGAIGLLLFVSNQFAIYRDRIRRERRTTVAPAAAPPVPVIDPQVAQQFVRIAEQHDRMMTMLIHHLLDTAQTRPHLTEHSPYLDLEFGFINASIYDLTFNRVVGLVSYGGQSFQNTLVPLGQVVSATAYTPIVIKRGQRSGFTLRQWISRAAADQLTSEILNTGAAALDTRPIGICFSYTNHLGQQREVCVGIPGSPFRVAQAT